MAGVGSMTKASWLTVEYRLYGMETNVGFGNIVVAHRLLGEIWRLGAAEEISGLGPFLMDVRGHKVNQCRQRSCILCSHLIHRAVKGEV